MSFVIFTATGCERCNTAKSFMNDKGISYEEKDIKGYGREAFNLFYRENRSRIYRGKEGLEFPILFTGEDVIQGVGEIIGWLQAGDNLTGFIHRSELSHGWIDGLNISSGARDWGDDFLTVLRYLKKQGLKIQLESDGRNADLLEVVIRETLVDRIIFELLGTPEIYDAITGRPVKQEELIQSILLTIQAPDYQFVLTLHPLKRNEGKLAFITPEEAAQAAALVEQITGNKKHPFFVRALSPSPGLDIAPLPHTALFKYRTACRRYMVMAEIFK
jgi:pyruvate formate lyase activating enzyme